MLLKKNARARGVNAEDQDAGKTITTLMPSEGATPFGARCIPAKKVSPASQGGAVVTNTICKSSPAEKVYKSRY